MFCRVPAPTLSSFWTESAGTVNPRLLFWISTELVLRSRDSRGWADDGQTGRVAVQKLLITSTDYPPPSRR